MLNIIFGELKAENYIFDPDTFFNHQCNDEWLESTLAKEMVKDIDKSEIISPHLIQSSRLGAIPPERLSGSVKTLILIAADGQHIFNASACGDNCAKWLLKMGEMRDVIIRLGYLMDFGKEPFEIRVMNTNKICHNLEELDDEVIDNDLLTRTYVCRRLTGTVGHELGTEVVRSGDVVMSEIIKDSENNALKHINDPVNHPVHYTNGKYECLDVMEDVFGREAVMNFCLLNTFKYVWRHSKKNGKEDLEKAAFYLNRAIGMYDGKDT